MGLRHPVLILFSLCLSLNCAARRPGSVPPLWQVYTDVLNIHLCIHMYWVYICIDYIFVYTYVLIIHLYWLYICVHICIDYIFVYVCMCWWMCVSMCIYIYIYIYMYSARFLVVFLWMWTVLHVSLAPFFFIGRCVHIDILYISSHIFVLMTIFKIVAFSFFRCELCCTSAWLRLSTLAGVCMCIYYIFVYIYVLIVYVCRCVCVYVCMFSWMYVVILSTRCLSKKNCAACRPGSVQASVNTYLLYTCVYI